jgi:hypothetical protein
VGDGDRGNDRQAEACTVPTAAVVGATESLKRAGKEVQRESRTLVAHMELNRPPVGVRFEAYGSAPMA